MSWAWRLSNDLVHTVHLECLAIYLTDCILNAARMLTGPSSPTCFQYYADRVNTTIMQDSCSEQIAIVVIDPIHSPNNEIAVVILIKVG